MTEIFEIIKTDKGFTCTSQQSVDNGCNSIRYGGYHNTPKEAYESAQKSLSSVCDDFVILRREFN